MKSIDFEGDWTRQRRHRHAMDQLAEGRLPGKWGLLQQIVGHWAIPNNERNILRLGKAGLDTLGTVITYRAEQRKLDDDGRDAIQSWLKERGYKRAFPSAGDGFLNFLAKAMEGVTFRKREVRNEFGNAGKGALIEFEIGPEVCGYYHDPLGDEERGRPGTNKERDTVSGFWSGPFVRSEDLPTLEAFVRERVWTLMGSQTLMLSRRQVLGSEDLFSLSAVKEEIDFISAREDFNDVKQLAGRSRAFLDKGRSRCVLFYGPPGTGKSTVARAIARELGARVLLVHHEAVAHMSDNSAAMIISLVKPGVLVLNDIDRSSDDHAGLLQCLDVAYQGEDPVLTVLTVNDISSLDPALLRPGRVHETRQVPEPSADSRRLILAYYVEKLGLNMSLEDTEAFIERSEGFSPADVKEFCETAFAMGLDMASQELDRIADQRSLYAGERCEEFNERRRGRRPRSGRARVPR